MRRPNRPRSPDNRGTAPCHPAMVYRPPRYLSALKWSGIGLAVLAAIAAAYVGYWFFAAGQLRDGVLAWIEARRQEGLTVDYARFDIGGFPFRLQVRVDAPSVAAPSAETPWGWEGQRLYAEARPWSPWSFTTLAPGNHALVVTVEGKSRIFHGRSERAAGHFELDSGHLQSAQLELTDLVIDEVDAGQHWTADRIAVSAELAPLEEGTHRTPVADLRLQAADLKLPEEMPLPLGHQMAALDLAATLLGPIPDGPLADGLARWRDGGGTIEVRRLSAEYGPLALNADGTLALDGELQPVGAFTARVEGFFETVDALRNRGIIRPGDAVTAKMILGVLAKRAAGGRTNLTIPVSVQDRHLFAGPVPLIEIPPISWGGL